MSIFVKFPNEPREPHIKLSDVRGQRVKIRQGTIIVGTGEVTSIGYTEDNSEGMITVRMNNSRIENGRLYTGGVEFTKKDDGTIKLWFVSIDA